MGAPTDPPTAGRHRQGRHRKGRSGGVVVGAGATAALVGVALTASIVNGHGADVVGEATPTRSPEPVSSPTPARVLPTLPPPAVETPPDTFTVTAEPAETTTPEPTVDLEPITPTTAEEAPEPEPQVQPEVVVAEPAPEPVEEEWAPAVAVWTATEEPVVVATQTAATPEPAPAPAPVLGVLDVAAQYVGYPYVLPSNPPSTFDCSSYTWWVYRQVGIELPRTVEGQRGAVTPVSDPQPGDLIFYNDAYHVGIYAGGGMTYEAANPSDGVRYGPLFSQSVWFGRVN